MSDQATEQIRGSGLVVQVEHEPRGTLCDVPKPLCLWLLGGFRVSAGFRTVEESEWRLRKAGGLIKLLALAPQHHLHRERVMDLLWPELPPKAAANNLRYALHNARRTLECALPDASHYLRLQSGQLALCPEEPLWIDVEAFEEAATVARHTRYLAAYETAIGLYAGNLLPEDRYEEWAEDRREELRRTYLALLLELAVLYEERAELESAIEVLRRVVQSEPVHEEACAGLMRLYARSGQRQGALWQYERLRDALWRKLSAEPGAASQRLYEEILAGRFPSSQLPQKDHSIEKPPGDLRHNLPAARTSFVGREGELVEVKRALAMTRLLTLTGVFGSGKTRLALEVAENLTDDYPQGVWLTELAATLEFEAAGCAGDHELLDFEGELLDSEIWQGTADQIAFRDRVLNAHIALSRKHAGAPKRDLSAKELDVVAGTNVKMVPEAAAAAGRLLASANADLAKAQAAGHADALRTVRLSANSGYRDSAHQKRLWLNYFARKGGYYDRTQTARERLADGPHSEQAVTYMLTPTWKGGFGLGGRIAAPGYSNHQGGIAIDFSQERKKGHEIPNETTEKARAKWRSTWFHEWLRKNAANVFGFQPIPTEEWHWEYRRGSGTTASASAATSTGPSIVTPTTPSAPSTAQPAAELVRFAQRVLNAVEGERLSDDGDLGRLTRAALERFRKKYGLGTGGMLDAPTELALTQRALEELAQASMFAQPGTRDARTEQALITFKSTRGLGMDAKLDAATRRALTDALARMAPKPASTSTYLGGKLWSFESKTLPMRVAVFCPQAALSMREVEVLVYAHGLLNGCPRPKSIPDGMITDAPFKLGGIVAASGRPIVLVVPYLDWANPGGESAFGKARRKWHTLGKPANLNGLVAEVLAELGRVQSIATPSLRNLVIAGHSRAYDLLEPLAHSHSDPQMQQGALASLSQVWAFDTTYGGAHNVSKWMSWLDANPGLRVSVFYEPGSKTGDVGKKFYDKRSPKRLEVIHAKEGHCAVPAKRLPALLNPPVSATDQETELPWGEDELDLDEANLGAEDYAPEAYNDAAGAEFYREFYGEFDEAFEPGEEHHEVDLFDPLYGLDEQHLSAEPELDALAFEALGSDDEYVSDEDEEFEFEDEDYADQVLEEEAYGFEQEIFLEPEAPPASEVVFPSEQSLRVVAGYSEGKDEEFWDPTGSGNPLLDTGPAHKEKKLSTNFTVRELTTSGGVSADVARIDPKLVESIQRLRDHLGKSVTITSGYRSWKRNKEIYAQRNKKPTLSQHCGGRGADIKIKGMNGLEIGKAAIDACGPNIGVGLGNTFAHIDVRGHAEVWNYGGVPSGWIEEIKNYQQAKGGKRKPSPRVAQPPNDLVRFAQRVLNAAEGERLDDDGDLGRLTRGALERFRRKYNLGAGGVLDDKTHLALAQRALEEIAQQSIFPQPGVLDAKTEQALKTFKSERGLGFNATLDAATRTALADALARRVSVPSSPRLLATPSGLPKLGAGRMPPTDPSAYRKFRLTTYHVVDQGEWPTGAVRVPIYDDNGRKIAEGNPAFFAQLSLEGTARLTDDRLINVTGKTVPVSHDEYAGVLAYHRQAYAKSDKKRREEGKKPTPTAYSGIAVENDRIVRAFAFHEVPASRRGIGYGLLRGIPLVPFRTLAADIGHVKYQVEPKWKGKGGLVPPGTHVYIKEYDGLRLPDGTTHDGWFVVNDTGGAIVGAHFDVFVGTRALRKQVKLPEFGQVWFTGIEQRIPPGYTYGLKA